MQAQVEAATRRNLEPRRKHPGPLRVEATPLPPRAASYWPSSFHEHAWDRQSGPVGQGAQDNGNFRRRLEWLKVESSGLDAYSAGRCIKMV